MSQHYSEPGSVHASRDGDSDTPRFSVVFVVVWGIVFTYLQFPVLMALTGGSVGDVTGMALAFGLLSSGGIELIEYFSDK